MLAALLLAPLAVGQAWREMGPSPLGGAFVGRVSAIGVSRTDPGRYYIGGADGGVWLTRDGGTTWRNLTDRAQTSSVGSIAVDPTDDRVVYVGTGEANYANHSRYGLGVLKTTDGGATWALLGSDTFAGRCVSHIAIDPRDPRVLYAGVTPAGGFPEKAAAKGHPLKDGPLGVFKSTDGGLTWTHLTNGLPAEAATDLAMVDSAPDVLYAAIGRPFGSASNGVYRSRDGGQSWTKLGGGLPTANVGRVSVTASGLNPNRVYALFVNRADAAGGGASTLGAYRSSDGGDTWTPVATGNFQATYGWYLCEVRVKPTNADTVLFAGLSLLRTTNAGASFSTVTTPHVDHHAIVWDAQGRLLVGSDGGVFRSVNDGGSYTALNNGLGTCQFYAALSTHPTQPEVMLGGLQDNGTVRRTTDTKAWSTHIGGDGGYTQIDQLSPNTMFAQFQGAGNVYRSTNGGASWSAVGSGISTGDRVAFFSPIEIDPTNSSRILLATHRLYRSLNGGTSWSVISGDLTNGSGAVRALAVSKSNPQVVWTASNDGVVSRSTDGGTTFTRVLTGVPGWPRVTREITIDPIDQQTVYLAVSQFGTDQVRRTTDGGLTWTVLDGDLPDVPVNVVEVDRSGGQPVLYAGTDIGVFKSTDGGQRWFRPGLGFPNACVIDIRLDPARKRVVVATQGRGAWELVLSGRKGTPGTGSSIDD